MSPGIDNATGLPWRWGATVHEIAGPWPCEGLLDQPYATAWRAVDVDAAPAVLFRWLCQMKVAPYSYDWIDNLGRRSPRSLTSGVEHLEVGQRIIGLFEIVDFEQDVHITGRSLPQGTRIFGPLAGTYRIMPVGETASRLVVRLDLGGRGILGGIRRHLVAWSDLVMMRKQLLTLKALAEKQAAGGASRPLRPSG